MNSITNKKINTQSVNIRNSGIELYKIIAILLIIISHCTQSLESFVDYNYPGSDIQLILLRFFRYFGAFGNSIFMVCSSYFLQNSKRVKYPKALGILFDSQLISIIIFLVLFILSIVFRFSFKHNPGFVITQLFPDLYEQVWFVPTYVVIYLIHPYLNLVIESLSKKKHFAIVIVIAVVYGIGSLVNNIAPLYSKFIGFVCIYFIISYISKYCKSFTQSKKQNLLVVIAFSMLFIIIHIIKSLFSETLDLLKLESSMSIVSLPIFIGLLFFFLKSDIKSKVVNSISSCSLLVYCTHENFLVRDAVRPRAYEFLFEMFGNERIFICLGIMIGGIAVSSFAFSYFYKFTFQKLTKKLSVVSFNKISMLIDTVK